MNAPTRCQSNKKMFPKLALPSRTSLRWRFAPYWTRISHHKRLLLILGLCGGLAGLLISVATPELYSSRTLVTREWEDFDDHSVPSMQTLWRCIYPLVPDHEWTIKIAGRDFGFRSFKSHEDFSHTFICLGSKGHAFYVPWPFYGVVAVATVTPFAVSILMAFIVCRNNEAQRLVLKRSISRSP